MDNNLEKNKINRIILASQSKARMKILNDIGINAESVISGADEIIDFNLTPEENLMNIAAAKLEKAMRGYDADENDYIISADTAVYHNGKYIGKPKDEKDAETMLRGFSGGWHRIYTGAAVYYRKMIRFAEYTDVKFIELKDKDITAYIKNGRTVRESGRVCGSGSGRVFCRTDYWRYL
ncbi:bifunctional dttp/utp pyrophosphatase/methyltransferase protein-related [Holotrichia oblita]|nr:bifunctional dttp/utp pyrophosphatase/methyltransferase protein-related [Holotrichia oblita]